VIDESPFCSLSVIGARCGWRRGASSHGIELVGGREVATVVDFAPRLGGRGGSRTS
jgi:hypothetical protein